MALWQTPTHTNVAVRGYVKHLQATMVVAQRVLVLIIFVDTDTGRRVHEELCFLSTCCTNSTRAEIEYATEILRRLEK